MYQLPVWVPSLKSWTLAIRLAIPAYGLATVVPAFEVWRFFLLGTLLSFSGIEGLLFLFAISLLYLLLALLWFLFWAGAYSLLLKLLWSDPPVWLRLPKTPVLVNRDFGVLVTSVLPIAIAFLIHVGLRLSLAYNLPTIESFRLTYETFLLNFSWLWFISAVFLYHSYYQIRARVRQRKRQRKAVSV